MAVLEPKNLVVPFTSTFNVAAILFVLFVFGIYRFAIGRTNDPALIRQNQTSVAQPIAPKVILNVPAEAPSGNAGGVVRKPEDLIRELLSPPSPPNDAAARVGEGGAVASQPGADGQKALEDNSLDDVEKALGLR